MKQLFDSGSYSETDNEVMMEVHNNVYRARRDLDIVNNLVGND